jgi:hypothetical protein
MSEHSDNFKAWYADVLTSLYPNRNAGIAVLMISLPLAERYLRQKNHVGPDDPLTDDCMTSLIRIFSVLPDVSTARKFWAVYRNGFLHQATLSTSARGGASLPVGWLSHDISDAVQIRPDGSFCVHPVLFSQSIVRTIESEFAVFAGVAAGAPPLAKVERLDPVTIPSVYLGTRAGP